MEPSNALLGILAIGSSTLPKSSSSGYRFLLLEFLHHRLAHDVFLDLPRHRHGKALNESDVARDFEVGDVTLAKVPHFFRGQVFAFMQLDPGTDLFPVFGIGHTDNLNLLNLGMGVEVFLDLARKDVFATANDHVLVPPAYRPARSGLSRQRS